MSNRRVNWQVLESAGKWSITMALANWKVGKILFALSSNVAQVAKSRPVVACRSNLSRTAWDQALLRRFGQ